MSALHRGCRGAQSCKQIAAFKTGERKNEMMSVVVQNLTPADIEDLAAYYSTIEISVGKLPAQ
jgi:cytochrome c553